MNFNVPGITNTDGADDAEAERLLAELCDGGSTAGSNADDGGDGGAADDDPPSRRAEEILAIDLEEIDLEELAQHTPLTLEELEQFRESGDEEGEKFLQLLWYLHTTDAMDQLGDGHNRSRQQRTVDPDGDGDDVLEIGGFVANQEGETTVDLDPDAPPHYTDQELYEATRDVSVSEAAGGVFLGQQLEESDDDPVVDGLATLADYGEVGTQIEACYGFDLQEVRAWDDAIIKRLYRGLEAGSDEEKRAALVDVITQVTEFDAEELPDVVGKLEEFTAKISPLLEDPDRDPGQPDEPEGTYAGRAAGTGQSADVDDVEVGGFATNREAEEQRS